MDEKYLNDFAIKYSVEQIIKELEDLKFIRYIIITHDKRIRAYIHDGTNKNNLEKIIILSNKYNMDFLLLLEDEHIIIHFFNNKPDTKK